MTAARVPGAITTVDEVGEDCASAHLTDLERIARYNGRSLILCMEPRGTWTVALGDGLAPIQVLAQEDDHDWSITQALRTLEREVNRCQPG